LKRREQQPEDKEPCRDEQRQLYPVIPEGSV